MTMFLQGKRERNVHNECAMDKVDGIKRPDIIRQSINIMSIKEKDNRLTNSRHGKIAIEAELRMDNLDGITRPYVVKQAIDDINKLEKSYNGMIGERHNLHNHLPITKALILTEEKIAGGIMKSNSITLDKLVELHQESSLARVDGIKMKCRISQDELRHDAAYASELLSIESTMKDPQDRGMFETPSHRSKKSSILVEERIAGVLHMNNNKSSQLSHTLIRKLYDETTMDCMDGITQTCRASATIKKL
jgi:hypothetical protein